MSKATKGPWHYTDHIGPYLSIYAMDGRKIVNLTEPFYRDSEGVGLANAALLAAAPDLREVCQMILTVLESMPRPELGGWDWPVLAEMTRAALANAEPKETKE